MKRALSEVELSRELDELVAELDGRISAKAGRLLVRPSFTGPVFPFDGYTSWQHRWYLGSGRIPPCWRVHH